MRLVGSSLFLIGTVLMPAPALALDVLPWLRGYGVDTRAAYGNGQTPIIIIVDTLNPHASLTDHERNGVAVKVGGFKTALDLNEDNKVILFEVSGWIEVLGSDRGEFELDNNYVTLAGQSAPSPGVGLKGVGLRVSGHDVLVQHFRVLPGAHEDARATANGACKVIPKREDMDARLLHHVVLDHLTCGWQMDDNGVGSPYVSHRDVDLAPVNITIANTIFVEGLHEPAAIPTNKGKGLLVGSAKNLLLTRNLFHSNYYRNPVYSYGCNAVVQTNNVIYNPRDFNTSFQTANSCNAGRWSIVGNVVVPGPNSITSASELLPDFGGTTMLGHRVHLADNQTGDYVQFGANDWSHVRFWQNATVSYETIGVLEPPLTYPPGYVAMPHSGVVEDVLANVGCRPADRSAIESRIVEEVSSGGTLGSVYGNSPVHPVWTPVVRNVGSEMPATWNGNAVGDLPSRPHDDDDDDGYTNLEEWLHALACGAEGRVCGTDSLCPEGEIIGACGCGSEVHDFGYCCGGDWREAPCAHQLIRRASRPPLIDGVLEEFGDAPFMEIHNIGSGAYGVYWLLWDDNALYVAGEVNDIALEATHIEDDAALYQDDGIEMMFDTLADRGSSLAVDDFKAIVNSLGAIRDFQGGGIGETWDPGAQVAAMSRGTNNDPSDTDIGYSFEAAIPWSGWGVPVPEDGTLWGIDFGMNDWVEGVRYWAAWQGTDLGDINTPDFWGTAVFSDIVVDIPCPVGWTDCNGSAVDECEVHTEDDMDHCGGCGAVCDFPNANTECVAGDCAIDTCVDGYADCDGYPPTGCETDTATDLDHCGGCGTVCQRAHATTVCQAGDCILDGCTDGYMDCNIDPSDGCEFAAAEAVCPQPEKSSVEAGCGCSTAPSLFCVCGVMVWMRRPRGQRRSKASTRSPRRCPPPSIE